MVVTVAGGGPAVEAVRAALADVGVSVELTAPDDVEGDLAVVVGTVGDDAFRVANERARERDLPWLAVELGGLGGHALPDVEAAVTGLGSEPCHDCLRGRVAANLGGEGGESGGEVTPVVARFAGALAGREAAGWLADGPSPGRLIEVPHAERRVLPLPGCACAGTADRTLRREDGSRSLDEALAAAQRGLDPRVGIVHETGEAESWPLPYYLATLCDTTGFSDVRAARNAAGVDPDWDRAFMKALGEALERYSAGVYRVADLTRGPAAAADDPVPLSAFVLPESADESRAWVSGENLATGAAVHLPAGRVFYPTDATPTITTGLGLGNSGTEALVAGLAEVIERDASMLAWYSTYEPLGLRIDDERFGTLRRHARSEDLALTATLLTQDVDVPVVAVAAHRDGDWPRFALGSAAALDPAAAAVSAGTEALQNWTELRGMGRADAANESGRIGHFASLPASARAFTDPETTVPAGSVADGVPATPAARLEALVERAAEAGLDAYAARLTPRDVEELGFEAVRVLAPVAQPLFVDDPYFGERADRVPRELGFEPRLNREHHPFP